MMEFTVLYQAGQVALARQAWFGWAWYSSVWEQFTLHILSSRAVPNHVIVLVCEQGVSTASHCHCSIQGLPYGDCSALGKVNWEASKKWRITTFLYAHTKAHSPFLDYTHHTFIYLLCKEKNCYTACSYDSVSELANCYSYVCAYCCLCSVIQYNYVANYATCNGDSLYTLLIHDGYLQSFVEAGRSQ